MYALWLMLLEMFVKSKLNQSWIVPSKVSQTARPIEEKRGFIFEPLAENALMWLEIKSEPGEWM